MFFKRSLLHAGARRAYITSVNSVNSTLRSVLWEIVYSIYMEQSRNRGLFDSYSSLGHHFRFPSLQHRSLVANIYCLHKYANSQRDSLYLVGTIQFICPINSLRNHSAFRLFNSRMNIRKYSILNGYFNTFNLLHLCRA